MGTSAGSEGVRAPIRHAAPTRFVYRFFAKALKSKFLIKRVDRKRCMLAHILRSTLLIKNFDFQWSRVAAAADEGQHELETRTASTTAASATGPSDLSVGGGLVRARPPPTLLASGCASAPRGLRFELGGDAALEK